MNPQSIFFSAGDALVVTPLRAQALPEGAGKDLTVRVCTGCHGTEMFAGYHNSKEAWDSVMNQMSNNGLSLPEAEYNTVLDYLSTYLGPTPAKVNINKVSSSEIAKALAITAAQADAIVGYREKNGPFKDLDGLKKVEGLDAAAIEARKSLISF
jgi:competence protein ComEA